MRRCKPGDLAVVIKCKQTPEMVGRFVIVEHLMIPPYTVGKTTYPMEHHHNNPDNFPWQVRSAVTGEKLPCRSYCRDHGMLLHRPMQDECLLPIRPGDEPDEILTERPIEKEKA